MQNILDSWQKVLLTVYFSLKVISGVGGNLIVCITFSSNRIHQTSTNPLIVNLAVVDMFQCLNFIFAITAISGITWFKTHALCQLNGATNVAFITVSFLSLTFISINRYFIIARKQNIFTKQNMMFSIFAVWLFALAFSGGPVIGWSEYICVPSYLSCSPTRKHASYFALAMVTVHIIPFTTLCFCTWKIFMVVYIHRRRNRGAGGL